MSEITSGLVERAAGPKPMNCIIGKCASSFPYKDECGLVGDGCCARRMLAAAAKHEEGVKFPMDLHPGGNPFVNALERRGLVSVHHDVTRARAPLPAPPAKDTI